MSVNSVCLFGNRMNQTKRSTCHSSELFRQNAAKLCIIPFVNVHKLDQD